MIRVFPWRGTKINHLNQKKIVYYIDQNKKKYVITRIIVIKPNIFCLAQSELGTKFKRTKMIVAVQKSFSKNETLENTLEKMKRSGKKKTDGESVPGIHEKRTRYRPRLPVRSKHRDRVVGSMGPR